MMGLSGKKRTFRASSPESVGNVRIANAN